MLRVPLCVVAIVSPESRVRDQEHKPLFYASLGISECLVLDILDEQERLRPQILVSLWRLGPEGMLASAPDDEGYVLIETIGVRLRADGRRLVTQNMRTGEMLHTSAELLVMLEEAERVRTETEQRLATERNARQQAEEEIARLRAELEQLRGSQS